jgi:hypothetical protein
MKYIKSGDKGQYGMDLHHSSVEEILKRYNSLDLYFQHKAEKLFSETHRIDSVIKETEHKRIYNVTCFKDCYYIELFGRFYTEEQYKELDERNPKHIPEVQ